jgi:hypothetical protein
VIGYPYPPLPKHFAILLLLAAAPVQAQDDPPSLEVAEQAAPPERRPVFFAGRVLLDAHLGVGVEPHYQGTPIAFGVGGEALWRGLLGVGLSLYTSEGSPILPDHDWPKLADRISVAGALALRPLAPFGWSRGDGWLARFLGGFGVQVGPSVEYFRTASLAISGCPVDTTAVLGALHLQASLEVPLLGDASTGWVSLRVEERIVVGGDRDIAPQRVGQNGCTAAVHENAVASQVLFGLAWSL